MDVGEHAELGEFDFNWTRFATIENKFNVVTTSMVGLQFFQNMIRLMAVTWSMVHAAVCFLAGCTVGCFGLHSDCNGMSGLVPTCRHEPLELWQKVAMSVG